MSRSRNRGCGKAKCGFCKPHKRWPGLRFAKPRERQDLANFEKEKRDANSPRQ